MQRSTGLALVGLLFIAGVLRAAEAGGPELQRGATAFDRGAYEEAAAAWKDAAVLFAQAHQPARRADALLNLGQAYHALGQRRLALEALEEALALADTRERQMRVKAALGALCTFSKMDSRAEALLRESLATALELHRDSAIAPILNDLGNLLAAQGRSAEAARSYREGAEVAGEPALAAKAWANLAAIEPEAPAAGEANRQALRASAKLPDSHEHAALLLTVGRTWLRHGQPAQALAAWKQAGEIALRLDDTPARSYALGFLGELYEAEGRHEDALKLTREAVLLAQKARSPDALFRWEWQRGRLLAKLGQTGPAIEAYQRAVTDLDEIHHDVAIGFGNTNRRSSFREAVGPLYYELTNLLLHRADTEHDEPQVQRSLSAARDTLESLKSAELVDYFQDDCVNLLKAKTAPVEAISAHTAVIYLVPLPDRTELLLGFPEGILRFKVPAGEQEVMRVVRDFRRHLETRTSYEYLTEAWQLYDWLIRPLEKTLAQHAVDTLLFVPDGAFRSAPLQALHDGHDFLVSKYAVAVTPGLTLMDAQPIQRERASLLLNGLSAPVQGYSGLKWVPSELAAIRKLYGGRVLADADFCLDKVAGEFRDQQYSIVHIASHTEFRPESRETFLLAYDKPMTLDDLERFIRPSQFRGKPVELITLSACQTAAGDDRAALGLAGVAVKSGARSALATLWFVNDQSSSLLIAEFYRQLHGTPGMTKAKALQAAQLMLLADRRYRHPCYWAPYSLIGNWL